MLFYPNKGTEKTTLCVTYKVLIKPVWCTYYVHISALGAVEEKNPESCLVCGLKGGEVLTVRQKDSQTSQIIAEGCDGDLRGKFRGRSECEITSSQASRCRCGIAMPAYPSNKPVLESHLQCLDLGEQTEAPLRVCWPPLQPFPPARPSSRLLLPSPTSRILVEQGEKSCAGCCTKQELCQELRTEAEAEDSCGAYILVGKWIPSNYHMPH